MAYKATRADQPAARCEQPTFRVLGQVPFVWEPGQACRGRSAAHYGAWFTDVASPWLASITGGGTDELGWISWIHLMVDFMMSTGLRPPVRRGAAWIDERSGPAGGLHRWDAVSTSRSLVKQVRFLSKEQGLRLQTTETRSMGSAFNLQTSCLWTPYPKSRLLIVDSWITKQLATLAGGALLHRHHRGWKLLPRPMLSMELAGR